MHYVPSVRLGARRSEVPAVVRPSQSSGPQEAGGQAATVQGESGPSADGAPTRGGASSPCKDCKDMHQRGNTHLGRVSTRRKKRKSLPGLAFLMACSICSSSRQRALKPDRAGCSGRWRPVRRPQQHRSIRQRVSCPPHPETLRTVPQQGHSPCPSLLKLACESINAFRKSKLASAQKTITWASSTKSFSRK